MQTKIMQIRKHWFRWMVGAAFLAGFAYFFSIFWRVSIAEARF